MRSLSALTIAGLVAAGTLISSSVQSKELSLAYFMGPKHPMNKGVMTPFGEKLKELSGGKLTVKQFPGGALNSVPPKQYAILLDGVADIIFTLPGYTADVFPKTNVVGLPGVCDTALSCTEALQRAQGAGKRIQCQSHRHLGQCTAGTHHQRQARHQTLGLEGYENSCDVKK